MEDPLTGQSMMPRRYRLTLTRKVPERKRRAINGILTQRRGYLSMEEIGCCSLTPPFKACIRNIPC